MIGRTRWRFAHVDSTQNVALQLAERGADHGTVVRADYQSAGRGRQGRSWEATPGSSLMFSVILRSSRRLHELGSISILVAEALADSLRELTSDPVQIKWPNDVMIAGRKVSGILLQTRSAPFPVAVLGIGINVDTPQSALPDTATSLIRHVSGAIDSDLLLDSILARLNTMWTNWQPELDAASIARLESRLWHIGDDVSILDADRELRGRLLGVAKNGGLRLSVGGSERVIVAGEITRGPRLIGRQDVN